MTRSWVSLHGAAGLLLCAAAMCSAFKPGAPKPAMPRPAGRSMAMCMGGGDRSDLRPRPQLPGAALGPLSPSEEARALETRVLRLERRVTQLNAMLEDLCSALLYCDDVALMERNARCIGEIYLDASFTSIRRPRVLRQEVVQIMNRHGITDKPLMYTWRNNRSSSDASRLD